MNRLLASFASLSLLLVLSLAAMAFAADQEIAPLPKSGTPQAVWQEIQSRVEQQKVELASLKVQLKSTTDQQAQYELQREVQRIKAQGELDIMAIQLKHARIGGDRDLVQKLEQAIHKMKNPQEMLQEIQAAHPTPPNQDN